MAYAPISKDTDGNKWFNVIVEIRIDGVIDMQYIVLQYFSLPF